MDNRQRFLDVVNTSIENEVAQTLQDIEKISDEWLSAHFSFYDMLKWMEDKIQHPDYTMTPEAYNTMAWNVSWLHADTLTWNPSDNK